MALTCMHNSFIEIFVTKELDNERLDKIMATRISRRKAKRIIKAGAAFVNRHRVKIASRKIPAGTQIKFPRELPAEPPAVDWQKRILHQDDHIIVVNKPQLWPTDPTLFGDKFCVTAKVGQIAGIKKLYTVQRLDFHTSGTLLFAKNSRAAAHLNELFKRQRIEKYYLAQVGSEVKIGFIKEPISKSGQEQGRFVVDSKGQEAVTEILESTLVENGNYQLKIKLHTGRTHQIRVHLSHMEAPVIGDPWYGNSDSPPMLLHSHKIKLNSEILGQHLWISPLPDYWN
ncbi:MAG: RluA family pseudouridine synthase [Deltaproteobacteria bacterium]|jgi:23S rRNA pseudouridine1911/1915/1917 synthase|nr:RluA family pseudouridine synthase [Deltaproteobacteria bacterium]